MEYLARQCSLSCNVILRLLFYNSAAMYYNWGQVCQKSDSRYREVWEFLNLHVINILDLSTIASGRYGRRPLILSALTRNLFRKRSIVR